MQHTCIHITHRNTLILHIGISHTRIHTHLTHTCHTHIVSYTHIHIYLSYTCTSHMHITHAYHTCTYTLCTHTYHTHLHTYISHTCTSHTHIYTYIPHAYTRKHTCISHTYTKTLKQTMVGYQGDGISRVRALSSTHRIHDLCCTCFSLELKVMLGDGVNTPLVWTGAQPSVGQAGGAQEQSAQTENISQLPHSEHTAVVWKLDLCCPFKRQGASCPLLSISAD